MISIFHAFPLFGTTVLVDWSWTKLIELIFDIYYKFLLDFYKDFLKKVTGCSIFNYF